MDERNRLLAHKVAEGGDGMPELIAQADENRGNAQHARVVIAFQAVGLVLNVCDLANGANCRNGNLFQTR